MGFAGGLFRTFIVAVGVAVCSATAGYAQSAAGTSYDHFFTGYPLTGAHARVDCVSCHVGGRFRGTARQCVSCHNGTTAQGKVNQHPNTTNLCEQCHVTSNWRRVRVDHAGITAACSTCHNGTIALGKPANHVVTNASCENCHKNNVSYAGAVFDHTGITAACATCHNGNAASGLSTPPHVPTGILECGSCHASTSSFLTYKMNHTVVSGIACGSCHSGAYISQGTSGAQGKGPSHVATTADCGTCHTSTASWAGATFSHTGITGGCASCHNGATATGLTTPPHIPTGVLECSSCHTSTSSFTTYTMSHSAASGIACAACHNGAYTSQGASGALGLTTPPHIPTGTVGCGSCHTSTSIFTAYTMNHAAVSTSRCDSCHNGSFTSEGTSGAQAKSAGHVATTADCSTCHKSTTSWAGATFTHQATDTACASCHNGTKATGMKTPPHIPTGTLECSNCHTNTATSFASYTMSHTAASGIACGACHNGSYTSEGTSGAQAKGPGHVATTADCSTCHKSTTNWAGATFTHATTDTDCSKCHNGTTATGMTTPPHIPTGTLQCSNCHANTAASFTSYTMNHAAVTGIACGTCHNGSYTSEGKSGALGQATPPHIPTGTLECSNCHTSTSSFTTYKMNHAAVAASRCDSCHNGSFTSEGTSGAQAKGTGHVATTADCSTCHKTTTSWAGAAYTHQANDTNCLSCHNGTTATGMTTPPHIPTATLQCSSCHTNTAASFTSYTMNHATVTSIACGACHNGSYTSEGTSGAQAKGKGHVTTTADCSTCHKSTTSWSGAVFTHAATDTNCSSCHNGTAATGMTTPPHIPTGSSSAATVTPTRRRASPATR